MPMAPDLPAEDLAQAKAGAGTNPAMYLMAAADLHQSGQLSAPVPTGKDLVSLKRPSKKLRVVK